MLRRRRQPDRFRRGRATVGWGALAFLTSVTALAAAFDSRPDLYDVEYATRSTLLRTRQAEAHGRPLLLAVGSSRTVMAFAPEQLPPLPTTSGADALPFNFAHIGAGPVQNLMQVSRILADGVRPQWMFLELMPNFVSREGMYFISLHTAARDIPVMHYHMSWHRLYGDYAMRRLCVAPKVTGELLREIAPDLAPPPLTEPTHLLPLGGCTFLRDDISPADRERLTGVTRSHLRDDLVNFRIHPRSDGATRALLDLCRRNDIRTVLVIMPEGGRLASWYAPGAREQFDGYCAGLSREYGVPVLDAREWLPDGDMYDEHHVLRRGAAAFTRRLGRDVLRPFLATGDTSWAARFANQP